MVEISEDDLRLIRIELEARAKGFHFARATGGPILDALRQTEALLARLPRPALTATEREKS